MNENARGVAQGGRSLGGVCTQGWCRRRSVLQAPHRATDDSKLAALVAAYSTGETVPPVIVEPNGFVAITGSHRIAAAEIADVDVPMLILTDADYTAACDYLGIDSLGDAVDHEEQCRAIYHTTDRAEVKAALQDQI